MKRVSRSGASCARGLSVLAGVAVCGASPAFGQENPAAGSADDEEVRTVVVTGSHIARRGFDMPTPVTTIDETDLAKISGSGDISDAINQIPSVRASLTNDSTANQSSMAGGTFADLRGLGAWRTLVLINGRRWVPTNGMAVVSTGAIPQAAIGGVDIVTGGASAAYGSDAVAGVINYKINDRLDGFKGRIQGGISDYGDYEHYRASVAFGTRLFNDRAHWIVAAEQSDNKGIEYALDRPWANNVSVINNPYYTPDNDEPRLLLMSNTKLANRTNGGVILSPAPLAGLHFLPDGTAVPMVWGDYLTSSTMVGGSGADRTGRARGSVPQKNFSLFSRLAFDATDNLRFFVEGSFAHVDSKFLNVTGTETLTVRQDNAFLPQSVRDVMIANDIPTITIGRTFEDNRRETRHLDVETRQIAVGVEGSFGETWQWDASYSGGWADNTSNRLNSRVVEKFNLAFDAVFHPDTGAIVCRSTITNPNNGCVPINLIGEGRASQAALEYVNGDGRHDQHMTQHVVAAKMRGEPFSTWAAPVGVAFGAEWRELEADVTSDPLSAAYAFAAGGYTPWGGTVTVKEAFVEALLPLARDARLAQSLNLDLATRLTDYSTSGTVNTWKVGLNWSPVDSLRFRATRSRDIRAPSPEELYLGGSSASASVNDPVIGGTYSTIVWNSGNPFLEPEEADTLTAGVVVSPSFLPRLQFSMDYWDIDLTKAMVRLAANNYVVQCYERGNNAACDVITRDPVTNRITGVIAGPINFDEMKMRGVDFEVSYNIPLGPGRLDVRGLATYFDRGYVISEETGFRELHDSVEQGAPRDIGGSPKWKGNTRITYSLGKKWVSLGARYVGGGRIDPAYTPKDLNKLRVHGRTYIDLSAEYPLSDLAGANSSIVLFGNVRNLFNTDPPITGESSWATTRSLYDVVGRLYSAGVKFSF
jgi:iron complex outermembrane receptor protein